MKPSKDISRLIEIMAALRTPDTGCPWDLAQDFASIAPYTIEEAYEVRDAIERKDWVDLCDELGDLLLQSVYHARMAEERGLFNFGDVVNAVTTKMIRRHPHVFGDEETRRAGAQPGFWENIKAAERLEKLEKKKTGGEIAENQFVSILDDVPATLPAITIADKLQKKAAKVGFDWDSPVPVFEKINEEIGELNHAIGRNDLEKTTEEIGDLMFSVINLARHLDVDPETALAKTNRKFRQRFSHIEKTIGERKKEIADCEIDELERIWQESKGIVV